MDNPRLSFHTDGTRYVISCTGCLREPTDCGSDRNQLTQQARSQGYKLVPGLGWICNSCYWATELDVTIQGSIETNPS